MQTIQLYSSLWHSFWAGNSFRDNSASNLIRKVQTTFVPSCPWFTVSLFCTREQHFVKLLNHHPLTGHTSLKLKFPFHLSDGHHQCQLSVFFKPNRQSELRERELMKHFIIFSLNEKLSILNAAQTAKHQASLNENTAVKQKLFVWISQEPRSILITLPSPFSIWFDSAWFCGKENSFSACHHQ